MRDTKVARRSIDRREVLMSEADEVRYWCEECGCSESELRTAVKAVGVVAHDVRAYLKKREVARFLWREGVR